MNKTIRSGLLPALLLLASTAQAELSANAGWVSDYYYRGLMQHSSSASAGIDYTEGGFYAGTWGADVGDGMEVDGYFGWDGEYEDFTFGAGFTGYYYTGDFDDTYQEVNLRFGYGIFSAEYAVGEYENFDGPTQDYGYYALTLEKDGLYGKYAGFNKDFDGDYLEFGYGFSVAELDLSIALIVADDPVTSDTDEALIFGIGKTFQIK
ncbi:TorF family putative porin [Woeseia oceani]|uniref:Outer membrane protein beta-barrel domain-containing protein n=1 Tax=Woeseia oceani TaxID=1548547 RepID=A0A193LBX1_9GAMM|nr:TorF family putative porin [Woeseia oceani]ANO49968.1 hypothetical protein BA177_00900 [Woeseia oceani]